MHIAKNPKNLPRRDGDGDGTDDGDDEDGVGTCYCHNQDHPMPQELPLAVHRNTATTSFESLELVPSPTDQSSPDVLVDCCSSSLIDSLFLILDLACT